MRDLLTKMFRGWIILEESWDSATEEHTKTPEEAHTEACGGDEKEGYLLYLFSYWSNDIMGMAPYYGVAFARGVQGPYILEDVPPPPTQTCFWDDDRLEWREPDPESDEETACG